MSRDTMKKAVILCAGKGSRLRPFTEDKPKVMVEIEGKPMLAHHVEWVRRHGVEEVYINLHYRGEAIREYFGDGDAFGVRITYCEEEQLRGTAGSLRGFRDDLDAPFLLHYGDVYADMDIGALVAYHREHESKATLVVHPSSHPEDSDIVVTGDGGEILELHHKPGHDRHGNLGNAACYLLEPDVLHYVDDGPGEEDFIQDVFPRMLAAGEALYGYETGELLLDMGTPERYRRLMDTLRGGPETSP